jgi:single-strand DNA-binding protein
MFVNSAHIIGRVGKIESRSTNTGIRVSNISLVTTKKFKKDGETQEKVTWHNVTFYANNAEIAEKYVNIGDLLYVQGEIDSQKYEKDGVSKVKHFILGYQLQLMPKTKEHPPSTQAASFGADIADGDVPW